ncbi:MAG TPA: hypothetical protein VNA68_02595 [Candidatus Dormibacteraeota bacterium]|nr:hypothetical protein [Candidatus Dormibacteraeota bacterium]
MARKSGKKRRTERGRKPFKPAESNGSKQVLGGLSELGEAVANGALGEEMAREVSTLDQPAMHQCVGTKKSGERCGMKVKMTNREIQEGKEPRCGHHPLQKKPARPRQSVSIPQTSPSKETIQMADISRIQEMSVQDIMEQIDPQDLSQEEAKAVLASILGRRRRKVTVPFVPDESQDDLTFYGNKVWYKSLIDGDGEEDPLGNSGRISYGLKDFERMIDRKRPVRSISAKLVGYIIGLLFAIGVIKDDSDTPGARAYRKALAFSLVGGKTLDELMDEEAKKEAERRERQQQKRIQQKLTQAREDENKPESEPAEQPQAAQTDDTATEESLEETPPAAPEVPAEVPTEEPKAERPVPLPQEEEKPKTSQSQRSERPQRPQKPQSPPTRPEREPVAEPEAEGSNGKGNDAELAELRKEVNQLKSYPAVRAELLRQEVRNLREQAVRLISEADAKDAEAEALLGTPQPVEKPKKGILSKLTGG